MSSPLDRNSSLINTILRTGGLYCPVRVPPPFEVIKLNQNNLTFSETT